MKDDPHFYTGRLFGHAVENHATVEGMKDDLREAHVQYPTPGDLTEVAAVVAINRTAEDIGRKQIATELTDRVVNLALGHASRMWVHCWRGDGDFMYDVHTELGFEEVLTWEDHYKNGDAAYLMVRERHDRERRIQDKKRQIDKAPQGDKGLMMN